MPFTSCANTNHDVTTFEIYEKVENIKLSNTEHDFFFPKNHKLCLKDYIFKSDCPIM